MEKSTKQNVGIDSPLPIPHEPRKDLSIYFVLDLPCTSYRHDSIIVIVDHFFRIVHFVPCNNASNSSYIAQIILNENKIHGLLAFNVFNRDFNFISYILEDTVSSHVPNLSFLLPSTHNRWLN